MSEVSKIKSTRDIWINKPLTVLIGMKNCGRLADLRCCFVYCPFRNLFKEDRILRFTSYALNFTCGLQICIRVLPKKMRKAQIMVNQSKCIIYTWELMSCITLIKLSFLLSAISKEDTIHESDQEVSMDLIVSLCCFGYEKDWLTDTHTHTTNQTNIQKGWDNWQKKIEIHNQTDGKRQT